MIDTERFNELEDLRLRAALVQHRLMADMTVEDVAAATNRSTEWVVGHMENFSYDPSLSEVRRYARAVGAAYKHMVQHVPLPTDAAQSDEDEQ